jgi:hypothetical protein
MNDHTDLDNTPLSPTEQQEYARYWKDIKTGSLSARATAEILWAVQEKKLYRDTFASMEAFVAAIGLDPEEGAKFIADGQATFGHKTPVAEPPRQSPPKREPLPNPAPDEGDELDENLADPEQVQQLADWIGAHKDELQEKFDNMIEGAQEGDRGQAVQEQIEALESAESSIEDEMTEEDLQNVIDELEDCGIRVPRLKGGKSKKAGKTSKVPDNRDAETEASQTTKEVKIDEALSQEEGLKRFKELDRLIVAGLTQSLIASRALREMEQGQYYTFGGFKTIAEYGMKIMKLAESTVYQHVNAGRVAKVFGDSTDCRVKPVNVAQLRPLLNVYDDQKVIEIWKTAATLYGEGGLTEKAVWEGQELLHRVWHDVLQGPRDAGGQSGARRNRGSSSVRQSRTGQRRFGAQRGRARPALRP